MSGTKYCSNCNFWYWGSLKNHLIKHHKHEIELAKANEDFSIEEYIRIRLSTDYPQDKT